MPIVGKKKKKGKKKRRGHYCKVCGITKANEKFSGKGHAKHICKVCWKLPKSKQYEEEMSNKLIGIAMKYHLTKSDWGQLEKATKSSNLNVRDLAKELLLERKGRSIDKWINQHEESFIDLEDRAYSIINDFIISYFETHICTKKLHNKTLEVEIPDSLLKKIQTPFDKNLQNIDKLQRSRDMLPGKFANTNHAIKFKIQGILIKLRKRFLEEICQIDPYNLVEILIEEIVDRMKLKDKQYFPEKFQRKVDFEKDELLWSEQCEYIHKIVLNLGSIVYDILLEKIDEDRPSYENG